jgi:multiple sugar transport system substrate-binding protein
MILFFTSINSCDNSGNHSKSRNSKWEGLQVASEPYRGATLKILGEDLPPLNSLNKLKEKFTDETGIKVEIDFKNHSKVIQSILEGALTKAYKYDIFFIPHKEMGKLVESKSVFPISLFSNNPSLRDTTFNSNTQFFQPFWTEVSSYNGEWYAFPLYLGGSVVVYRKDLLNSSVEKRKYSIKYKKELKEPTSIDDWKQLAEFFYRPNQSPPLYGISLLLSDESLWYEWQSVLFAMGGNVLDIKHGWEYGDIVVNSPNAVIATELYKWFSQFAPPDASTYSWGQGIAQQQAGTSFMTLLQYDVVSEFENSEKTKFAGKFGYFIPPSDLFNCGSQVESWVGFIPTSSKNPEASYLFLQWMMSENIQLSMHLEGNISPRISVYNNEQVQKLPYTNAILKSLTCMFPKPTIPEASAIQDIITRALQAFFSNRKTAKDALDDAALKIKERLGNKSKLKYPITNEK